jgi:MYXO-CTERM domain-containing protein
VPGCCVTDADCDDGNQCTVDTCSAGAGDKGDACTGPGCDASGAVCSHAVVADCTPDGGGGSQDAAVPVSPPVEAGASPPAPTATATSAMPVPTATSSMPSMSPRLLADAGVRAGKLPEDSQGSSCTCRAAGGQPSRSAAHSWAVLALLVLIGRRRDR